MAVTLADAILGSLTVKQMTDGRFALNGQVVEGLDASGLDVAQFYGGPCAPGWQGTSRDLGGVFASLSPSAGLSIAAGTITLPFRARSNQSTFAGSSSHPTVSCANGLVVPRRVTVNREDGATVALEAAFRSTDGTDPITFATSATINADAHNARWHLGPVTVNGGAGIAEVVSVDIDFGIQLLVERFQGNYPERIYIQRRRPRVSLTFQDMDEADGFAAQTVMTAAEVFCRKRSGASFVSDVTEVHVLFTFGDGIAVLESLGASQGENGTGVITFYGEAMTVDVTSAIA